MKIQTMIQLYKQDGPIFIFLLPFYRRRHRCRLRMLIEAHCGTCDSKDQIQMVITLGTVDCVED